MASADARAILAQIPYDFYGGEICTSVGTRHDRSIILNERRMTLFVVVHRSDDDANLSSIENTCLLGKNCCTVGSLPFKSTVIMLCKEVMMLQVSPP
jgi:hypothetical protein